jgi:hypothetical protein
MPSSHRKLDARTVVEEIVRRCNGPDGRPPYVIRLSEPPTPAKRLQLIAARLTRTPVAIMPHKCATKHEWTDRYGGRRGR